MNWRQILERAKAKREKLQKQLDEIRGKIYRLDKEIFKAEMDIKKMDERRDKGLRSRMKIGSALPSNLSEDK